MSADAAANELRMRRHYRLHQLFLAQQFGLAVVAGFLAVLGDRMQGQARLVLDRGDFIRRGADQQHVAVPASGLVALLLAPAHAMPQPVRDLQPVLE